MNQETPTINPQFSKLTSHIAVKEILDYKVYEASVPLIYDSKWSKSEDIQINNPCQKENQWCKAAEQFHEIIEADFININNDLQDKTEEINSIRHRQRRSVMATFLGYCCGVASKEETQDLYVGETKLAYNLQSLYNTLDTDHSQLSKVATSVETMTDQANHFLKMTKETIADTINKTENINQNEKIMFSMVMKNTIGIFQSIEAQRKSRIIDICKENKIPHIVVPLETLRSDLTELDEKISREGYTLSLKTEDITAYYSAEIATCMFSPSKIAIKIQIPIIKKNKKYSISKLIPIPFAWKDVTCIAQQEKEELWISSEYNTQVSKINTEDCKKGLCFMRRVRTQIPSEATCINLIIKRKNHKLMELCQMKCYHTTKTTVTQIKEDHLIITHPSNDTEILCSENKKIITENITYGALEVWLPCNCQIWDKKTIIVENTFPCDSRVTDYLNISHIIPQQWTKWATMPKTNDRKHNELHI
uniref:Uncharacterized protein n=1 Tax=Cacopsylla melanoneura TaxID=428564 RepID=A0A8D8WNN8_9HEMI